jgi:tetratricopeptide (TPR) repeat protein
MKKIDVYLNEAEFSTKAKRYLYAAKCFNYIAKLFLENNNPELASKYFVKGAEIWSSLENFYEAGQMYLHAAILSNQYLNVVNNALSCFYGVLTDFTNNDNYFKAALCVKYISSCYKLLNQEESAENHLKRAAELFVKSGMTYLKLEQFEKAVLCFEYAVMCYENLGLTLQSIEVKGKILAYKNDLLVKQVHPPAPDTNLVSEGISTKKVLSTAPDNTFVSSADMFTKSS